MILALSMILIIIFLVRPDISVERLKEKYTNETSKFVDVDGLEVHYRDEGEGYPVVLIHGTASSLHTWDTWAKELSKEYRVIRMDLPGFGITGPKANHDYSMNSYVEFLNRFLNKLNIEKSYMAGNSLGGGIAWEYSVKYPEQVEKMVLLDASGYIDKNESPVIFKIGRIPIFKPILRYVTPRYIVKMSLRNVYGDDTKITDEVVDRYYELLLREGNREAFTSLTNSRLLTNQDNIKKVKAPTLILWGEEDNWIPLDNGYRFQEDIQNSKLITYDGVGHLPMEEIPEETVNDTMKFFLE